MNQNWNLSSDQSASILISSKLEHLPKLLPQKIRFQKYFYKKYIFKIALSKNEFSKLLFQKKNFENCSLKKYIFKIIHLRNIILIFFNLFFIRIIRWTFYDIDNMSNHFFVQYLYSFLKRPADNGFDLSSEENCLLLNKYD